MRGLCRAYGGVPVVRDVDLDCAPGTVTGLVGTNGAGKSTVLRVLLGLTRADAGTAEIAGRAYARLRCPSRVVGAVLDPSALHPGRSGRRLVEQAAAVAGVPPTRVDAALREVGLSPTSALKRVGAYSLGMRQRLCLATALVAEPQVLVLDEPANGLDPEGIAWLRELLRGVADRGGTVLLSSHQLREVQATADQLVVMAAGRVVAQGPLPALLPSAGLRVRADDPVALRHALLTTGATLRDQPDGAVVVDLPAVRVGRALAAAGVAVLEMRPQEPPGLEDLFLELTGTGQVPA